MCNLGEDTHLASSSDRGADMLAEVQSRVGKFQPDGFIRANQALSSESLSLLKGVYDFTKQQELQAESLRNLTTISSTLGKGKSKSKKRKRLLLSATERPINQLIVDAFDADQIWQELQLQNNLMYETLVSSVSKILAKNNSIRAQKKINQDQESSENVRTTRNLIDHENEENLEGSEDDDNESVIEFEGLENKRRKTSHLGKSRHAKGYPKSEVDDKFFNLAQMTEFLENVEAQIDNPEVEDADSEDDIDMFADIDEEVEGEEDQDERNVYYDKFFDKPLDEDGNLEGQPKPKSKSVRWNLGNVTGTKDDEDAPGGNEEDMEIGDEHDQSESNEEEDEPSNFEKKRRKIEENIEQIEQAALESKPWKYQGEITAEKRPENSLLEEHLVYDSLVRAAPEITVETTLKLEDIIKQRIKDKAWDDVERKVKPVEDPSEFKKKIVLSAEKSKMSLAQIYEQEYINKKKAEEGEEEVEAKPEEELVIERDMKALFHKLDALSNFHYTPKPISSEIRIVTNVPAIAMEEVAPVNVADSTLLAPQEIQAPTKGEIKGVEERTDTDRKRERRIKKKKQKFIHLAKDEKAKRKEERLQAKLNAKSEEKVRKNQIKFK